MKEPDAMVTRINPDWTKLSPEVQTELMNRFVYHAPFGDQVQRYQTLRDAGFQLAVLMHDLCPESRELSLALTKLDAVIMFANAAIARRESADPVGSETGGGV